MREHCHYVGPSSGFLHGWISHLYKPHLIANACAALLHDVGVSHKLAGLVSAMEEPRDAIKEGASHLLHLGQTEVRPEQPGRTGGGHASVASNPKCLRMDTIA